MTTMNDAINSVFELFAIHDTATKQAINELSQVVKTTFPNYPLLRIYYEVCKNLSNEDVKTIEVVSFFRN